MIKKDIFNHNVKALFRASAKDRLHRFVMADKKIKGTVVYALRMIREMQANHGLGPLETLVLGQAYIAAALMSSGLKGKDRISLNIQCSGPVKGLDVEANVFGEVRGYLKQGRIRVENLEKIKRLSTLFGAGFLTVTKYLEEARTPYSGRIPLEHGSIAEDLAVYYLKSEQIPTGLKLSVHFDENEEVAGAGGILLQAMPGAEPKQVEEAENVLRELDSLGAAFAGGTSPEEVVNRFFSTLSPQFLDASRVEFFCRCSAERMGNYLKGLDPADKSDILENGPFPLEIRCHHCNSSYGFTQKALVDLLA